jgi:hypothetical protein
MTAKRTGKKTGGYVTPERIVQAKRARFNPMRNFEPEKLARQIEEFEAGRVGPLARIMDALETRDDMTKVVSSKAKKSVSRQGFDIVIMEGEEQNPRAKKHREVLTDFYAHLTATHALMRNQRGGVRLLVRQMMDSFGKLYAAHEILWKVLPDGKLTAELVHVPLWFFEATTGRLRFLETEGSVDGVEMPEGEWLVTVGEGVGIASAVAAAFKKLALNDWLVYSERNGAPGLHGKTPAKKDSPEWRGLAEALTAFAIDWTAVTGLDDRIEKIDLSTAGTLPYPPLVERMDRAIAALWRGGDLSSMSSGSGEGTGASLQGDESTLLDADNVEVINEALNAQLDPFVIRYALGDEVPLAYFRLQPPRRRQVDEDIKVDEHLAKHGVKLSKSDALARYGRAEGNDAADQLTAPAAPAASPFALPNEGSAAAAALARRREVIDQVMARLDRAAQEAASEAAFLTAADAIIAELPGLLPELAAEDALALGDSLLGAATAAVTGSPGQGGDHATA